MTSFGRNILFVFTLFFYALFITSCDQSQPKIRGKLLNVPQHLKGKKIYLNVYTLDSNILDETICIDSSTINEDGYYSFSNINLSQSFFFDISDGENNLIHHFFSEPNQKLKFDFDYRYMPPLLLGTAQGGKLNHFLEEFSDTFYRDKNEKEFYYAGSNYLLAPQYAEYIDQRRNRQLDFIYSHLDTANSNSLFLTFIINEINYQWANDKTAFLWKKWIRNEEVPLDSSYYNFTHEIKINNPEAMASPAYKRFLHLYIRELYRQWPIDKQNKISDEIGRAQIASNLLTGTPLNFALLSILKDEMSNLNSLGTVNKSEYLETKKFAQYLDSLTSTNSFSQYFSANSIK